MSKRDFPPNPEQFEQITRAALDTSSATDVALIQELVVEHLQKGPKVAVLDQAALVFSLPGRQDEKSGWRQADRQMGRAAEGTVGRPSCRAMRIDPSHVVDQFPEHSLRFHASQRDP